MRVRTCDDAPKATPRGQEASTRSCAARDNRLDQCAPGHTEPCSDRGAGDLWGKGRS